jgi:glutaredoxin-like protein NrdH
MAEKDVFIYALSTCPHCKMAKRYLDENNVPYEFTDVDLLEGDEFERTKSQVKEISGGLAFPVIKVGDEVIVGFNKVRLKELLVP